MTLVDAFQAACPTPFADLGAVLGSGAFWEIEWGTDMRGSDQDTIEIVKKLLTTILD